MGKNLEKKAQTLNQAPKEIQNLKFNIQNPQFVARDLKLIFMLSTKTELLANAS